METRCCARGSGDCGSTGRWWCKAGEEVREVFQEVVVEVRVEEQAG